MRERWSQHVMAARGVGRLTNDAPVGELNAARLERLASEAIRLARAAGAVHLARAAMQIVAEGEAVRDQPCAVPEGAAT